MKNIESKTVAISEVVYGPSSESVTNHYCAYCTKESKITVIGSSRSSRRSDDLIYYCTCDTAIEERQLKLEVLNLRRQLRNTTCKIEDIQKREDKEGLKQKQYESEIKRINKKYKRGEFEE